MEVTSLIDSELFTWVILPLLIFFARIVDVSIGTMRIIYVARGMKILSALCGFFEVMLWLLAITQIMQHLSNVMIYVGYAGGFATGNYIGILIESKLAMGLVAIRAITRADASELIQHLAQKDFGVTSVPAQGVEGKVHLVFSIVKRKDALEVLDLIRQFNPRAFISIEDVRSVSEGQFPPVTLKAREFAGIRTVRKYK